MTALPFPLPSPACDTHVHIIGPAARFPFDLSRVYTPGEATVTELNAWHKRLGIARVVLVQPSVYGTDNACLIEAMGELGPRARAVAVIGPETTEEEIATLHRAGARGARVNLATSGMNDPERALAMLSATARQVARHGWHVQVLTKPSVIASLGPRLAELEAPLVVDHFGLPDLAAGPEQPGMVALAALLQTGRVLVKLSAIERQTGAGQGARLSPFIRILAAANPNALLWGSDWPHTGGGRGTRHNAHDIEPFEQLDDGLALAALAEAVDRETLERILVYTPARLYDFATGEA